MGFIENRISFVCIDTSERPILMDLPHICWLIIDKLSLPSLVLFEEMNFYYRLFVQWYYWGCSAVHCSKQYRSFIVNENVHWHAKQNSLESSILLLNKLWTSFLAVLVPRCTFSKSFKKKKFKYQEMLYFQWNWEFYWTGSRSGVSFILEEAHYRYQYAKAEHLNDYLFINFYFFRFHCIQTYGNICVNIRKIWNRKHIH